MFDVENIIKKYTSEDGSIPPEAVDKLAQAVSSSVGREFVEKERYSKKLEEIETLKTEKQTAEDSVTTAEKWKTKYQALKDDFESYKGEQTKKEARSAKEKAYRELLKQAGVSEKRIDAVLRVSDVDSMELDENGIIKDAEKLTESIKNEWADFIQTTTTQGAQTATPPANRGTVTMTKADIYQKDDHGRYVLSASERQKALMENQIT